MKKRFSPVVTANVKLFGPGPSFCVDVFFKSKRELQALIDVLIELRDSKGDAPDHTHLQDYAVPQRKVMLAETEVVFHRPRLRRTYAHRWCVEDAAKFISDYKKEQNLSNRSS